MQRREMVRPVINLAEDKWEVGDGGGRAIVAGIIRLGSGARSWDLRAFPLFFLPAKSENINGNCEQG